MFSFLTSVLEHFSKSNISIDRFIITKIV